VRVFAKLENATPQGKGSSAGSAIAESGFIPEGTLKENRRLSFNSNRGKYSKKPLLGLGSLEPFGKEQGVYLLGTGGT
jgi:hypothetical protein